MSTLRLALSIGKKAALEMTRVLAQGPIPPPLQNLYQAGFRPNSILDIGAHVGSWTTDALRLFPSARIHMIEAQPELGTRLQCIVDSNRNCSFQIVLIGARSQDATRFVQMDDESKTGSSLYGEQTGHPRHVRELRMRTLDEAVAGFGPFDLVKLDVQGAELDVLGGADKTVRSTEVIIAELSIVEFNKGAPLATEVIGRMDELGFPLFDFASEIRDRKGRLLQANGTFVRRASALWPKPPF
jgi:FkbM family methyltransferase